jgi:hypothetical protein
MWMGSLDVHLDGHQCCVGRSLSGGVAKGNVLVELGDLGVMDLMTLRLRDMPSLGMASPDRSCSHVDNPPKQVLASGLLHVKSVV